MKSNTELRKNDENGSISTPRPYFRKKMLNCVIMEQSVDNSLF